MTAAKSLLTAWGSPCDEPLLPDVLLDPLLALAPPVDPVSPEVVWLVVLVLPLVASDDDPELVVTDPLQPPFPDEPLCAVGSLVAEPEEVDPVDPDPPEVASEAPSPEPAAVPEPPEFPESPELSDAATPSEPASPVSPESVLPEVSTVWLEELEDDAPDEPPTVIEVP